jgi:hypothetical protein
MTGSFASSPRAGVQTFKNRQSSLVMGMGCVKKLALGQGR